MLFFGHLGIALGAAWLPGQIVALTNPGSVKLPDETPAEHSDRLSSVISLPFARKVDYRLLFVGSLLPDIIDKPLGLFFLRDAISNGRIFSHTLLFLILGTLAGICLYRKRRATWLLAISLGTFTHLVLDGMWGMPRTLLWPLFGFAFDKPDLTDWLPGIIHELTSDPTVYIPELVGIVILVYFSITLVSRRKVIRFLKLGET